MYRHDIYQCSVHFIICMILVIWRYVTQGLLSGETSVSSAVQLSLLGEGFGREELAPDENDLSYKYIILFLYQSKHR